jgi:hypothetical protein
MMSWDTVSAEGFVKELSEFLTNNAYEDGDKGDQHNMVGWGCLFLIKAHAY